MKYTSPWINANVLYQSNEDVYEDLNQLADNPFSIYSLYSGCNISDIDSFIDNPDHIAEQLLSESSDLPEYSYKYVKHELFQYRGDYSQDHVDIIYRQALEEMEKRPDYRMFVVIMPGINMITVHYIYSV